MVLLGHTTMTTPKNKATKQTAAAKTMKPEPTAAELLSQIEALARKLKTLGGGTGACFSYRDHGVTILCACQNVRDRMSGKDF